MFFLIFLIAFRLIVLFSLFLTSTSADGAKPMCSGSLTTVRTACHRPFMSLHFKEVAEHFCANLKGILCKAPTNEEQNTELFKEICQNLASKNGRSPVQLSLPPMNGGMEIMLCFHGQETNWGQGQQAWMMPSATAQFPFQNGQLGSQSVGQFGQNGQMDNRQSVKSIGQVAYPSVPGQSVANGQMGDTSAGQSPQLMQSAQTAGQLANSSGQMGNVGGKLGYKHFSQEKIAKINETAGQFSEHFSTNFTFSAINSPTNSSSSTVSPLTASTSTISASTSSTSSPSFWKKIAGRLFG